MPIHFDYETDTLYLKGTEKGIEKGIEKGKIEGKIEFIKNLLLNTDFTVEKIALLVGVSTEYVQKVKSDLELHR